LDKVRVVEMIRGPKKRKVLLFYGRIKDLRWDPDMYTWPGQQPLMSYNTKLGRDLLRKSKPPLRLAQDKWPNMLPPNFEFD
jgi:hypothetical protein